MKIIHQIIIESVSGGFWKFCGYWIMVTFILGIPTTLIMFMVNRPLRHYTLRKNGYPPIHCDVDGDFKDEK
jgi:hypothetical protein